LDKDCGWEEFKETLEFEATVGEIPIILLWAFGKVDLRARVNGIIVLVVNDCVEFREGNGDGNSENGDGVEGYIKDVFVKNEEIIKEVKYGNEDKIDIIEVVGMKNNVKGGIEDVEDGIIVNNSVLRDCRTLLLMENVV